MSGQRRWMLFFSAFLLLQAASAAPISEDKIKDIQSKLKGAQASQKAETLVQVERFGPNALPLLNDTIGLLSDPTSSVRKAALQALISLSPQPEQARNELFNHYDLEKNVFFKREIAYALCTLSPPLPDHTENSLRRDTFSPHAILRKSSILALGALASSDDNRVIGSLEKHFNGDRIPERLYAAAALYKITKDETYKKELNTKLTSRYSLYRRYTIESISRIGIEDADFFEEILTFLNSDPDPYVRSEAAIALSRLAIRSGLLSEDKLNTIYTQLTQSFLQDKSYQVRSATIQALVYLPQKTEIREFMLSRLAVEKNQFVIQAINDSLLKL